VFAYRGWVDLAQGGVPMKLIRAQLAKASEPDYFEHNLPHGVITTHAVRELAGGAFYPTKVVQEDGEYNVAAPQLGDEAKVTLPDGTRVVPPVTARRYTWECTLVEVPPPFADDFFVLTFPAGQKLYDRDAGQVIGAIKRQPFVKKGQVAPPLAIAQWLDGKPLVLDELKGQEVVLDFWGLWCSACRNDVPQMNALVDQLAGKPVTFLAIHNADGDAQALAEKIAEFQKTSGWKFAIRTSCVDASARSRPPARRPPPGSCSTARSGSRVLRHARRVYSSLSTRSRASIRACSRGRTA
jgi:thiol-disulfide isomerase/thioredoxin